MAADWLIFLSYAPKLLATWVLAALVLVGCGFLVLSAAAARIDGLSGIFASFWLGLGLALGLLQAIHLLLPIDGRASLVIALIGSLGLAWGRGRPRFSLGRRPWWAYAWALASLGLGLWLANRATGPVVPFDAGLYHLSALRWTSEYPIVLGLGNLHDRLALNISYILYLAGLGVGPWQGMASNVGPGLLLWVAGAHSLFHLIQLFAGKGPTKADVFFAVLIVPLVRLGFQYGSSPSPDLAVFVFGYSLAWGLWRILDLPAERRPGPADAFLLLALCAAGLTVKASLVPLAAGAALVAIAVWNRNGHWAVGFSPRQWACLAGLVTILPGLWLVRGVVLSGYPLFPTPVLRLSVPWAVPHDRTVEMSRWVMSWARAPGKTPQEVLGDGQWLWPWVHGVVSVENRRFDVLYPLALAALGLASAVRLRGTTASSTPWRFLLPPAVGGLFWFLVAPDPRLSGVNLWWLGAGAAALGLGRVVVSTPSLARAASLAVVVGLVVTHWTEEKLVNPGPMQGFHPMPQPEVTTFITESGLTLFVPQHGSLCWDAPLPCTPSPDRGLNLLVPGDLGGGFAGDGSRSDG